MTSMTSVLNLDKIKVTKKESFWHDVEGMTARMDATFELD